MSKYFKKLSKISMFTSIAFILVGLFLIIKPETTLSIISYILGLIILVNGIMNLIRYFMNQTKGNLFDFGLITGVFLVIIAVIFISNPEFIASIIPLILGIWIFTNGIIKIQFSLNLKNYPNSKWTSSLVISIVSVIFGLFLIFNPFKGAVVFTKSIGIFLVIYAVLDLIGTRTIRKTLDDGVEFIK